MSLSKSDKDFVTRVGEWRKLDAALADKQRRITELEATIKKFKDNEITKKKFNLFDLVE